jgi:hypothetical protein
MKLERYKRIEELYHSVIGRKPEERAAFLEQSCGADEALRSEVESLLSYEEGAKRFIETPPDDVAAAMLTEQKQSMVGRTLGHYRALRTLDLIAQSRSKYCRIISRRIPSSDSGWSGKQEQYPAYLTLTSARCMTLVNRTASTTW